MSLKIAVLLSGSGRTLENFVLHVRERGLPVEIVAVASNRSGVRGVEIARDAGLPLRVFERGEYESRIVRDAAMFAWLQEHDPDIFCLAGYLALLDLAGARGKPVLNIHPALLPAHGGKGYYGDRVHAAVLEAGEAESGASVHLVDEEFDRGPVLRQTRVPVLDGDDVHSLAQRVFEAECELYPSVLRDLASGQLQLPRG